MKKMTLTLAMVLAAWNGYAQEDADLTIDEQPEVAQAQPIKPAPAAGAPTTTSQAQQATGSTTAPLADQKPADEKKWSFTVLSESFAPRSEFEINGLRAAKITSVEQLNVKYKVTPNLTATIGQDILYVHVPENTSTNKIAKGNNSPQLLRPFIGAAPAVNSFLGSEKFAPLIRYYVPVAYDRSSRDTGSYGLIRGDIYPAWKLTKNFGVSAIINPRISLEPRDNVTTSLTGANNYVQPTARILSGLSGNYSITENLSVSLYSYMDQMFDYNNNFNFNKSRRMLSADKTHYSTADTIERNNFNLGASLSWSKKIGNARILVYPYVEKMAEMTETYRVIADKKKNPNGSRTFEEFFNYQDNMTYALVLSLTL